MLARTLRWLAPGRLHPLLALLAGFVTVLLAHRLWIEDPGVEYGGGPIGALAQLAHTVNLLFHEAGHLLLMATGWRPAILLAGTAMQLAVPALMLFLAVRERRTGAVVVVLNLLSASCYSAAVYVADARERALPLLTGDSDHHDWGQLLYEVWDLPGAEDPIALVLRVAGIAAFVAALAACVVGARRWSGAAAAPGAGGRPPATGPYGR
ncbi:hypothetical protein [Patulibacter defluvii]|uniref:hypothetical protein n=1 Tax=Patulibacter defluvii TaxID=3095358 RepID=UPI002A762A1D|nr:hypothetical protein [Patulibacter sp. DM4]